MKKIIKTALFSATLLLAGNVVNAQLASEKAAPTADQIKTLRNDQSKSAAKTQQAATPTASQKPASSIPARAEISAEKSAPVSEQGVKTASEVVKPVSATKPAATEPATKDQPVEKSK